MHSRLNTLKAGKEDQTGQRIAWRTIAQATGISEPTLLQIKDGKAKSIRLEFVDALCTYFDCEISDLFQAERVALPLALDLRPDRHGVRPGALSRPVED